MKNSILKLFQMLGPGLLWAGAAIGVSHLVQSTRAGANYGFALVGILLLANLFKYPFFEYGPRYAASTGKTLLMGYRGLGQWAFFLYLSLTFLTMFTIQGAVTLVTSGVLIYLTGTELSPQTISFFLLIGSLIILLIGKYSLLDKLVKGIIILLTITTIIAVIAAFANPVERTVSLMPAVNIFSPVHIGFLLALMGWMPSAVDISVWSSIWTTEKRKQDPEATTLKNALFDFNIGYIGTVIIALGFLSLGALVMYGTGASFSPKGAVFAGQLINLYTDNIGAWSKYLVAFAALATMFSTTLTCLDAYGRVLSKSVSVLRYHHDESEKTYLPWIIVVIIGSTLLITLFSKNMRFMIDLATTLSFLTAPILAILNFKVVMGKEMGENRPNKFMQILSVAGIIFLTIFSLIFLKVKVTEYQKKSVTEQQTEQNVIEEIPKIESSEKEE